MSTFIFGRQVRAARILLGWSQSDLAREADIGLATLKRFEASTTETYGQMNTATRIKEALERGGVVFIPEDDSFTAGLRLRKK